MSAFSSHTADCPVHRIEIGRITPAPFQPRRSFDEEELHSLADSIRRFGLLSPLLVRRLGGGRYELIAGERRLRAMELLGWKYAEARISARPELDCALLSLVENLQREDLHFLDEAEACRRILQEHGCSREELAAALAKSTSALANLLRLLRLGRSVRSCIRENGLSERHARALLQLSGEEEQLAYARRAAAEQLSVRQLEALIAAQPQGKKPPSPRKPNPLIRDNRLVINALKDTVRQLRRIGVPVSSRVEARGELCEVIITIQPPPQPQ